MILVALKLKLIQKIIETDDFNLLSKIESILNESIATNEVKEPVSRYKKTEDIYTFNDWQLKKIEKALNQYENGECISDEEAQKEIQQWLED